MLHNQIFFYKKQPPEKFQTGGRARPAPVLGPPLNMMDFYCTSISNILEKTISHKSFCKCKYFSKKYVQIKVDYFSRAASPFQSTLIKLCFGKVKTSNRPIHVRCSMYPFQGEIMSNLKENGGKIKSRNFLNSCQQQHSVFQFWILKEYTLESKLCSNSNVYL